MKLDIVAILILSGFGVGLSVGAQVKLQSIVDKLDYLISITQLNL